MKKNRIRISLLAIVSVSIFSSCGSIAEKDDTTLIKDEIELSILEKINDPESYSFVEMQIIDTVYYSSIFGRLLQDYVETIESSKSRALEYSNQLNKMNEMIDESGKRNSLSTNAQYLLRLVKDDLSKEEKKVAEAEAQKERLNLISEGYNQNSSYFTLNFSYRENNEFGAKVLKEVIYEASLKEKRVDIIWKADKEIVENCRSSFLELFESGGVDFESCNDVFSDNAKSKVYSLIEDEY